MSDASVKTDVVRITAVIDKNVAEIPAIVEAAKECGIVYFNIMSGRTAILKERQGLAALLSIKSELISAPAEVVAFLAPLELEESVIAEFTTAFKLDVGGRGAVWSEDVVLGREHEYHMDAAFSHAAKRPRLQSELTGICCIVQRGQGDIIARTALESGISVPVVTFGEGTGVRDKMGLWRITIPAQKEVVNVLASSFDAEVVMDMMIDAAKLDQPGRGFIYSYPVRKGLVNTRVNIDTSSHAASIEQVIAAIDELKGDTQWRSRSMGAAAGGGAPRAFLQNLIDLTVIADEGRGMDLVTAAMTAGAAGATISKSRHICIADDTHAKVSPAREACSMIIGESQAPAISASLEKAGVFDENTHGRICIRKTPRACTYLGKKK
jgi:hypothetical protein